MPVLLAETEVILQWSDLERRVPKVKATDGKRSSGIHLSGVIKATLQKLGLLDYGPGSAEKADEMPLVVMQGMFFEEGIVTLYPDLIWQPGEASKDGITGSPDGLTPGPPMQLEEFKLTRKSQGTRQGIDILNEKLWMWQLMGYLHMLGLTLARLHVLWDVGDYRERRMPLYYTYLIQFSESELERFWVNIILKNKDLAVPETH